MWENGSYAAPCTVSRKEASTAFLDWLAAYAYTLLTILKPSLLNSISLVYVPYFHFAAGYHADYTVNVGDSRMEPHTIYSTVYENGRSKQVPHTTWISKTEWRAYLSSGRISGDFATKFAGQVPRGGNFDGFVNEASWHSSELIPTASVYEGGEVLPFSRGPEQAYADFGRQAIEEKILKHIKGELPGDSYRDLKFQWNWHYYRWTQLYLPYWKFSCEYEGKAYVALLDGRRASRITGQLPTDIDLRRSVNKSLMPLWISLAVGGVFALGLISFAGASVIANVVLGLIVVAVSTVAILSLKRRHEALSTVGLARIQAADQLRLSLESGNGVSDAHWGDQNGQEQDESSHEELA